MCKQMIGKIVFSFVTIVVASSAIFSQTQSEVQQKQERASTTKSTTDGIKFSGLWYINYRSSEMASTNTSQINLDRGYFTIARRINSYFSIRVTEDLKLEKKGDTAGELNMRLKYGYIQYAVPDYRLFKSTNARFGVVPRPWLAFEQSVNQYRVQGKMFVHRARIVQPADYGVLITSQVGGTVSKTYQSQVNKKNPGRFGSLSFGWFHGGGYSALEENNNRIFAGRITLRPLPEGVPGLQLTYGTAFGKGNKSSQPDYNMHTAMLSFESRQFILTGQYYTGEGNDAGTAVNADGQAIEQRGYSFFADIFTGDRMFSFFSRYDFFEQDYASGTLETTVVLVGAAYHFAPGCKFLLDYDISKPGGSESYDVKFLTFSVQFAY